MCEQCSNHGGICACGSRSPYCHCKIGSKCPFCGHDPLSDTPNRNRQYHEFGFFPHPFLYDKSSGTQRWQYFRSDRPQQFIVMSSETKVFACVVCHLICSLHWEGDRDGFVEGSGPEEMDKYRQGEEIPLPGATMLCKRHHNLWKSLVNLGIPGTKWPSQIIRGMVYNFHARVIRGKEGVNLSLEESNRLQMSVDILKSQPSSTQKVIPLPIFGMGWTPLGGAESITAYNFFSPMSINRPNTETQQNLVREESLLSQWQSEVRNARDGLQYDESTYGLYRQMLSDLIDTYPPSFKTCLNCGQSEIPLNANQCPFCNNSDLVNEVDPEGVVPVYSTLTSTT